jgi:transposase
LVATVFNKNRDRLLAGEIAERFFAQVLEQARTNDLLSDEHFRVDGHANRGLGEPEKSPAQG